MKSTLKNLFTLLCLFVVLAISPVACKSAGAIPSTKTEVTNTVSTKEVIRDTVFTTKKDSSYYKAWLECHNGKVTVKGDPITKKGNHLERPLVKLRDNYLQVDCEAQAQRLFAKYKDTYTNQAKTITQTNIVTVERELSNWQHFQIWCGWLFMGIVIIAIFTGILRLKNII